MSKFRVGDKVKVSFGNYKGKHGTVDRIYEKCDAYLIEFFDGKKMWFYPNSLELAEKPLKQGDRVNYIGKDVQIKAGNPYKIVCESKTRVGYALIESELYNNIYNVATKNLVRIQEPVKSEPFAYVKTEEHDPVNHPKHYTKHPSGIECIQITEHMNFNLGNAIKYIWRHDDKGDPIENLEKAQFYINREIERIKKFVSDSNGKLN